MPCRSQTREKLLNAAAVPENLATFTCVFEAVEAIFYLLRPFLDTTFVCTKPVPSCIAQDAHNARVIHRIHAMGIINTIPAPASPSIGPPWARSLQLGQVRAWCVLQSRNPAGLPGVLGVIGVCASCLVTVFLHDAGSWWAEKHTAAWRANAGGAPVSIVDALVAARRTMAAGAG